ncbi:hypothetical protein MKK63_04365 [Methylobacterium sp. J-088]|uniref:hypothetical protein n=1 Tax=unclassified Methylobacterium TaxID=2615210 RepID=UPI001FBA0D99|nr:MULTISPECIES: hypothetical protein [unclassified Methylobacterium]MCJ2061934.1 hypothetical protein [Methylobacterium sp. J-088]
MKLAMLACLAALCLVGPIAHAAPGEASKPAAGAKSVETPTPHSATMPHPATAPAEAVPAQARPGTSARVERRRRSYAACNRASHQRGLRGGKRRRFLIRCRLGYERTRGQAGQPAGQAGGQPGQPAGQPVQPGRKP